MVVYDINNALVYFLLCVYVLLIFLYILFLFFLFLFQEPTDIPSRKKLMRWVCARGLVCQKREFTVRSSSCEVMIRSKKMAYFLE